MPTKRKNPADATLRNVRAAAKRTAAVGRRLDTLALLIAGLDARLSLLEAAAAKRKRR